ncbi:hypothetical protein A1O3_00824 [Capronia epimyces CBS 606.96]|uniref:Heterokaryon incompatibility domain-containing protein n=1 Tax=Capronia epimyces CBS 606.96 TaxID=1182542 RepID=W9ZCL8_9EURO|nr:uncharacterized protein A1O3_00824 [Capronia epimyces CBS 606.96]EXJ92274.1 hypothetical protein A1O3_00824 [Capronia epimyces CBS 606.96]
MAYLSKLRQTLPARHPDYPASTLEFTLSQPASPSRSEVGAEAKPPNKGGDGVSRARTRLRTPLPTDHPDYHASSLDLIPWEREQKRALLKEGTLLEPLAPGDRAIKAEVCVNLDENGTIVDAHELVKIYPSTLERLYHCAKLSAIKPCPSSKCLVTKELLLQHLRGRSTWCTSLLEWMVQCLACYFTSLILRYDEAAPPKANISLAIFRCAKIPVYGGKVETADIDVLPDSLIYDMVEWIAHVDADFDRPPRRRAIRDQISNFMPPDIVYEDDFNKAMEKAEAVGICKNRLWNLISCCPRQWRDLPALLSLIDQNDKQRAYLFKQTENLDLPAQPISSAGARPSDSYTHEACTSDLCHFSSMDSTRVAQRHKCSETERQSCPLIQFPPTNNTSLDRLIWNHTVEPSAQNSDVLTYKPVLSAGNYIAISHVWSDGTGAGTQGRGLMNNCLFQFFCNIAQDLDSDGLWWDAVSIPTDPKRRAQALRNMHLNFSLAKHTVVHDEYLLRIPWRDDGTPCLALVLSPWFTRGWTAVELLASKSVKVLFGDPDDENGPPVIKDLETDVLATFPTCSLGHIAASFIVRRLWTLTSELDRTFSDLMRILRTRSNSWPRDRVVVAALLAGIKPEVDAVNMQARVMQQIITSYHTVSASILIHGAPTITEHGPLSWCPSNLFSGDPTTLSTKFLSWDQLFGIDPDTGALDGIFSACALSSVDPEMLEPISMHPAVRRKLDSAFIHKEKHLLLSGATSQKFCLVVRAMGLRRPPSRAIECEWVGVVLSEVADASLWTGAISIRIGTQIAVRDAEAAYNTAEELLRCYCAEDDVDTDLEDEAVVAEMRRLLRVSPRSHQQ